MTCEQVAEQLDIYVLDGLDSSKAAQVTRHVETCEHCRAALEQARRTADVIALVTVPPKTPEMKQRILSAVQPVTQAARPRTPLPALRLPEIFDLSPASLAIVIALTIVVAGVIWGAGKVKNRLDVERQTAAALQAQLHERDTLVTLMTASSATAHVLSGTSIAPAAGARFYVNRTANQAGFVTWNLPPLPAGKAYQLWLIDARGVRTSGGIFEVGSGGTGSLVVRAPLPIASYREVGVTIEPTRGSRNPTGPRVLAGTL